MTPQEKLSDEQANELRCIASEIIIKLFMAKQRQQLQLLSVTANEAMKQLEESGLINMVTKQAFLKEGE